MPSRETRLPTIIGDKTDNETDYRDSLPQNMVGVDREILGDLGYLITHSGLRAFGTANTFGFDRGGYWNDRQNAHFRVIGQRIFDIDENGVATDLGAISGNKQVSMAHSFQSQAIVADGRMWRYDGFSLVEVVDPDLGSPIDICWINSYYFLTDGENLYHTQITDESQIDPLQFATSEFSPDKTLAVAKTQDNQVIVFNRFTTEYFIDQANPNFAFTRIEGKAIKSGIVGTHCKCELKGTFYVIGGGREEDVSIHRLNAGRYTTIATREIDKVLATYTDEQLEDAVLEVRVEDGYEFIVVRLPADTLLYNATIAQKYGNKIAWTIVTTGIENPIRWRGRNGIYDPRISQWIYGDAVDNRYGILDDSIGTQYDEGVTQEFFTTLVNLEAQSIDKLEINIIPGHQVNAEDVTIAVSMTLDGLTYGKEYWNLYSEANVYDTRFIIRRLGYIPHNVGFKFRCTSVERLAVGSVILTHG